MELNMKIEDLVNLFPNRKDNMVIICNIEDADAIIQNALEGVDGHTYKFEKSELVNSRSITYKGKTIVFVDEKDAEKFCSLVSKK